MTRFREQIEAARRGHKAVRFEGDLAGVLGAEPPAPNRERPPRRIALRAVMALAVAACLLLAVGVALNDAGDAPGQDTPPVAKRSPPNPTRQTRTQRRPPWSAPAGLLTRGFKISAPSKTARLALTNTKPNQASRRRARLLAIPTLSQSKTAATGLAIQSKPLNASQRQRLLTAMTAAPRRPALVRPVLGRPTLGAGSMRSSLTPASLSLAGRSFGDRS